MKSTAIIPVPTAALRARSVIDSFWSGKSPRTVKVYRECLARISAWAASGDVVRSVDINAFANNFFAFTPGDAYRLAHDFKGWALGMKKWSPAYVNQHLAALRSLVKFARRIDVIAWALDIEDVPLEAYRDTRGPGFDGLVRLVEAAAAQSDPWRAARDTAWLTIFATMGLRLDEVVSCDLSHLWNCRLSVKRKKKPQRVWVTMPVETLSSSMMWLAHRGMEPGPLFLSRQGSNQRLTGGAIWKILSKKLGPAVGLKVWPHGLRHAAITEVLELTNGNIRAAQKFAAHGSPLVTGKYDDNRADVAGEMSGLLAKAIEKARKK